MSEKDKCSGILRKSHKWKQTGGKEGAFFVSTSPRCTKCEDEDLDECMKTTFKEAFPSQDYTAVNVYVNLKPKAEVLNQEPQQEKAKEITKEETTAPTIAEA